MLGLLDCKRKVEVYRNLNVDCFSVRQDGIVLAHTNYIVLKDATFVVRKKGREKVLREKRKNVHAFVRGFPTTPLIAECDIPDWELADHWGTEVKYDPYKYSSFVNQRKEPVKMAAFVDMILEKDCSPVIMAAGVEYA